MNVGTSRPLRVLLRYDTLSESNRLSLFCVLFPPNLLSANDEVYYTSGLYPSKVLTNTVNRTAKVLRSSRKETEGTERGGPSRTVVTKCVLEDFRPSPPTTVKTSE